MVFIVNFNNNIILNLLVKYCLMHLSIIKLMVKFFQNHKFLILIAF